MKSNKKIKQMLASIGDPERHIYYTECPKCCHGGETEVGVKCPECGKGYMRPSDVEPW